MKAGRREILAGLLSLGACGPVKRGGRDVFAAGQPAAILLLALAPDRLIGWPRRPDAAALALLPDGDLPETGALSGGGAPASLEAVAGWAPSLVLDYGDVNPRYRAIATRTERRLGAPYRLLDGALAAIPQAFIQAGDLLGRHRRGKELAERSDDTLHRWRGSASAGPTFYYARSQDGLETGFAGSLATETLEGAGCGNVAAGANGIGRVSLEQVAAWDPEALVTLNPDFANAARGHPVWSRRRGGAARRLLLVPDLPFGWLDRPPSINRLLGCSWLAGGEREVGDLAERFWRTPAERLARHSPRWIT